MNVKKFNQRIKIFSEILYDILNVESNYRSELNILNLELNKKIEELKNKTNKLGEGEVKNKDKGRLSVLNEKITKFMRFNTSNNVNEKKLRRSNVIYDTEENPLIDKLLSDSLQKLLVFYKSKHKIISQQVTNLGRILYQYTSQKKIDDSLENSLNLNYYNDKFDNDLSKVIVSKNNYYQIMSEFENIFYNDNMKNDFEKININDKRTKSLDVINTGGKKKKKNGEKPITLEDKMKNVVTLRNNYKEAINDLNNSKREYMIKVNEISSEMQEFNIEENNILSEIFNVYDENIKLLSNETKNFNELYEKNKKIIQDFNVTFGKNLIIEDKINKVYQYEEYIPKHIDINNKKDLSVLQKMNKLIGLEIDKLKNVSEDKDNNNNQINNINTDINTNNNIINEEKNENVNLPFILIMDKFIGEDGDKLTNNEIKRMKSCLNEEKYIKDFLCKLNKVRNNPKLFKIRKQFDTLVIFFNHIFTNLSFNNPNNHELVKILMILAETFKFKENGNKIYLINFMKFPKEFKDVEFWKSYIDIEIKNEHEKCKVIKNSQIEYIVLLSNSTHLREYLKEKDKIHEIFEYFFNVYKFNNDEINNMKKQFGKD